MWELYDELIAGIDEGLVIDDFLAGCAWSMIRCACGRTGIAMTVKGRARPPVYKGGIIGDRLKDVAECAKSWNFIEASLGMAAINCWYNQPEKMAELGMLPYDAGGQTDAFRALASEAEGKRVAVIGHFPHLEEQLAPVCALSILERAPENGDYPDSACEYILSEQDMVFITGMTLTNKTLPRLLQLTRPGARVILVGPTVPLSPVLYRRGVTDLDGFCVQDAEKAALLAKRGDQMSIFQCGSKVMVKKPGV